MFGHPTAFCDQAQLVAAELELTRGRIRFALADRERRANGERELPPMPPEFAEAERFIAARVRASLEAGVALPITWLRERLRLGTSELRILWVLLAHELDAVSRTMLRQINTENCADPTTDTVRIVAFEPCAQSEASRLLASNSPLLLRGLIERTDIDANASDHRKTWKVARRIVALAHGDLSLDPELFRFATIVPPDGSHLGIAGAGLEIDPEAVGMTTAAVRDGVRGASTVIVQAQRGTGRRTLLRAAAAACDVELLEVDLDRLATNPAAARVQLLALARECRLFDRVPLLRDLDALVAASPASNEGSTATGVPDRLAQVVLELEGLCVLATTTSVIPGNRLASPQIIEPRQLTGLQRARLWLRALPTISIDEADLLAMMYPVAPSLIDAAARVARAQRFAGATDVDPRHIRIGLRAVLDGQLAGLATRIETTQNWDALVLPAEQREAIDELIGRVLNRRTVYETWELGAHVGRGLGVSALFSGPPGTGKTMAAGLIANELSTDLYQVDMSKIVSKWIGETEKNLARLFDAAEAGHAILLFDEADALFGKRTEVKTSNDRHANQETNYLLQRLESFRGVCILTTNNDTAIDVAFRRRIALHVHFPMPELEERTRLWSTMIRPTIPVSGRLDLASLATRYEMSGGHIRNAVLRAAFFAASTNTPVSHHHLSRAAELEYHAMGRIMPSLR